MNRDAGAAAPARRPASMEVASPTTTTDGASSSPRTEPAPPPSSDRAGDGNVAPAIADTVAADSAAVHPSAVRPPGVPDGGDLSSPQSSSQPPRRPHLPFGFNTFLATPTWSPDDVGRAATDIRPGALVRHVIEWQNLQPTCWPASTPVECQEPGPIDWRVLDGYLQVLRAYRVKVLPVVLAAPRWAWGTAEGTLSRPGHPLMPPGDDDRSLGWWADFVDAVVEHIETRHPGLLAGIEVWNEPNSPLFWTHASGPDPERFARVLCAAYGGVRAVDLALPVIFGGVGEARVDDELTVPLGAFVSRAYAARNGGGPDIRRCMSSLGVHPYGLGKAPTDPDGGFLRALGAAREAVTGAGDRGRRLSITEFGYHADGRSEELQAERNLTGYRLAADMSDVDMMLIHTLFDADGVGGDRTTSGVCRAPRDPRPSARLLRELFRRDPAATC